jgi:hypothetical protein
MYHLLKHGSQLTVLWLHLFHALLALYVPPPCCHFFYHSLALF